jgi:uncharacterized phage protein (TIGR02218 family)
MSGKEELYAHMKTGVTTTCRAWSVKRRDGVEYGFTDHDRDLSFEGMVFRAETGVSAGMLQQSVGTAVDNTHAMGALRDDAISEKDIEAGRFDGAAVVIYLVNWNNVDQRVIRFRGSFGAIEYGGGTFKVEIRSLTESLSQQTGRVYQSSCPATLGDHECKIDTKRSEYSIATTIRGSGQSGEYYISQTPQFEEHWFEQGRAKILNGEAYGLSAIIKVDKTEIGQRRLVVWPDFAIRPKEGDDIKLTVGCNKLDSTCREKFDNFLNFRGFPNIPSADWIVSQPASNQWNDGGSRTK